MFRPGFGTRENPLSQDSIFGACGAFCAAALTKDATGSPIWVFFCKLTVPPQPPPPQPPKIKSSDSDESGLVVPLLLSSKRLSLNFEDFILGGGPPECYFGRWPPAYYSRTPLPTVKKEQEILRAKFANPASPSSDPPLPSAPSQPTQP